MIYTPRIQSIFPELPCVGLSYFFKIQQKSKNTVYSLKLCQCFANRQHKCITSCIVLIYWQKGQIWSALFFYQDDLIFVNLIFFHISSFIDWGRFWLLALDRNCHIVKEYVKEFQLTVKIFWLFLPKICNSVQRLVRWQSFLILPDENILLQILVLKFWSEKRKMARRPVSILCP